MSTFAITAEIRNSTDKGLAIFQGERHEVVDERTGEIFERDHFVWLPRKLATIKREWRTPDGRRMAEIEIPEWLAKKKELT
jgi:hypothetical protein